MSIRWKIILAILAGGLLVLAASFPLSLFVTQSLRETQDINLQEIGLSETIDDASHGAAYAGYVFLDSGEPELRVAFARELATTDRALAAFKTTRAYLASGGERERAIVGGIDSTRPRAVAEAERLIKKRAADGRVSAADKASYQRAVGPWLEWNDRLSKHEVIESEERRAAAVASTQGARLATFGLGFLALLVSALVGWALSSQMLRPIKRLNLVADAVASGDLTVKVGDSRRDEIGALERAFDRMRVSLSEGAVEHHIAQTLQAALLTLPGSIPGVRFAHAYNSATQMAAVGGDFYDLFELEQNRIGMTVGDVSGKGIEASALTSLIKNTVRAHASEGGKTPADVVTLTNKTLYRATNAETFATVFFGVLDRESGGLAYCSGGHTAAAILHADGSVEKLPANSPLIGAYPQMTFSDSKTRMDAGATIFLYTDGLIEARLDGGDLFGEDRLFRLLEDLADEEPERLVERVFEVVVDYAGGKLGDDAAVLAVQRIGAPTA